MDEHARQYLEAQITTATPQKLRLMLIEGAIRSARRALEDWQANRNDQAIDALIHCREIISELVSGIRLDQGELASQVANVYLFLYRNLAEAQLRRDAGKVEETIEVLELERETWQLVCEKLPGQPFPMHAIDPHDEAPAEIAAPLRGIGGPMSSAFSLDA
jgi:flagellar protein FliS